MSTATGVMTAPIRTPSAQSRGPSVRLAGIVLAALLVSNVPLFVCMPLTADTVYYDMQANNLLNGGTLYRDLFEPNLPGVVWVHVSLRSVLGWSSEALRGADVLLFSGSVWLLTSWVRRGRKWTESALWTAVLLYWFYFSISEWCHCQRDTWMLLPALGALALRRRQMQRLIEPNVPIPTTVAWSVLEGLCWGAAFWIKPHVAVPAFACWLFGALQALSGKRIAFDLLGLLSGGLVAGAAGVTWLLASGTWPYFLDTFLHWNADYVAAGRQRWSISRLRAMEDRMFPWILVHLVAVPLAVLVVWKALRIRWGGRGRSAKMPAASQRLGAPCGRPQPPDRFAPAPATPRVSQKEAVGEVPRWRSGSALFAVFYLSWTAQAFFVQHEFDYVQAPAVVLAVTFLAGWSRWLRRARVWKPTVVAFVLTAALMSPANRPDRLRCWWTCLTEGSTPNVRDRLSDFIFPDSRNLQRVADFLSRQHLRDGELVCYNNTVIYLYPQLNVRPGTRYAFPAELITLFPSRKELISAVVAASPQRFVVTDLAMLLSLQHPEAVSPDGPLALPPGFPAELKHEPPWCYPIVFRAGRYLVHRVPSQSQKSAAGDQRSETPSDAYFRR